jgi:peptidyl-prolyl cis-trans isomerase B (cyclophilin B)
MHIVDQIKGVATGSKLGHKDVPLTDVLIEKIEIISEE